MPQKHKNQNEIVAEQAPKAKFEKFKMDVETLELRVRKNKAQTELMGTAIDERIFAFAEMEVVVTKLFPELLPAMVSFRNNFISSINMPEADYMEKMKVMQANIEQQMKPVGNPSEQLHAIGEQIEKQPADIPVEDDVVVEPTIEPFIPESQSDGVPAPEVNTEQ